MCSLLAQLNLELVIPLLLVDRNKGECRSLNYEASHHLCVSRCICDLGS
jgi:hypothetical protein